MTSAAGSVKSEELKEYTRGDVLVGPEWLEEHLHDHALRVVEVDVSRVAYDEGHIPGAVLWNIYQDLKDANYQLVGTAALEELVTRSGIAPDCTVVFYGYAPAMGLWIMKLFGHANVRLLDCPRGTWLAEGRPWTTNIASPVVTRYPLVDQDPRIRADRWEVEKEINDAATTIVDVRTDDEYRGGRFWPSGGLEPGGRAGHIPSAVNLPLDGLYNADGTFRSPADLRQVFSSVDPSGNGKLICYCTIGARACTAWFALSYLLGNESVRVYDGSWAQWGRLPTTPVVCALQTARSASATSPDNRR